LTFLCLFSGESPNELFLEILLSNKSHMNRPVPARSKPNHASRSGANGSDRDRSHWKGRRARSSAGPVLRIGHGNGRETWAVVNFAFFSRSARTFRPHTFFRFPEQKSTRPNILLNRKLFRKILLGLLDVDAWKYVRLFNIGKSFP